MLDAPIPMILFCPACVTRHIDEGEWATPEKAHRKHLCANCGHIWKPALVSTVGVRELVPEPERELDDVKTTLEEINYYRAKVDACVHLPVIRRHTAVDTANKIIDYLEVSLLVRAHDEKKNPGPYSKMTK